MSSELYTPDDIRLAFAESFTLHTMEEPGLTQAYAEFDRFIAKVKADARNETIDFISRHYEDYLPAEWSWKVEKELRGNE